MLVSILILLLPVQWKKRKRNNKSLIFDMAREYYNNNITSYNPTFTLRFTPTHCYII